MLEIAILGLLIEQPLHGYRLKIELEKLMGGCISVNYGAIYPLLRRWQDRGAIAVFTELEGKGASGRRVYSLTAEGRDLWKQMMLEHPQESWVNARSRFMIKFCFLSYLTPAERLKLLNHRLMSCVLRLENEEMVALPVDVYRTTAKQFFKAILAQEIEWLREQMALIQVEITENLFDQR
ncbi:MAG: PadR family transcriptional regulator [Thermosynechococcaceae cyanobacterium]